MADNTPIEWTDATWNPITGCTLVSEGCRNCYAARLAATRMKHHPSREGLARINAAGQAKFTGEVRSNDQWLDQPIRWRKPRRIFVCAHGDLFHESVPHEWIDRVFAVMALAPRHTFQVLTKRPERAREYLSDSNRQEAIEAAASAWFGDEAECFVANWINGWSRPQETPLDANPANGTRRRWPLPNVWLGTSVEDQATADARIPHLLATPAAVRFVSAEPLLGELDLSRIPKSKIALTITIATNALTGIDGLGNTGHRLDWVIVGGESGPNARPMRPDWARSLRDECQAAGVAFHFKQWGGWAPDDGPAPDARDRIMAGECQAAYHDGTAWQVADHGFAIDVADARGHVEWVYRTGKRAAGRLLDGRTWDELPEAQHG